MSDLSPQELLKDARGEALAIFDRGRNRPEAARFFLRQMTKSNQTQIALLQSDIGQALLDAAKAGDRPEFVRLMEQITL